MPNLGTGLSLGSVSRLSGFDFDASVFINQAGIASEATIPLYGTNILPSSNNFSDTTTWQQSLCSITPNATSNPFGTANDASLLSNISASFGNILRMDINKVSKFVSSNTRYMISIYAKANASNFIGIRLSESAGNSGNNYSFVNLSNGSATLLTPTNGTNHSLNATLVGNGWYRVEYSFTNISSTANTFDFACCGSDGGVGTISSAGTRSVYIWGAQLEVTSNTIASPYAETASSDSAFTYEAQLRTSGTLLTETINPRKQINDFVVGVKGLGLWNNLLCWPLRSYQNLSSGLTAYSLGGLGAFNGTLSGMTTSSWRTAGVHFDGSNDVITTSFTGAGINSFCGYVGNCIQTTASGNLGNMYGDSNSSGQSIYWLNPRSGFGGEFRFSGSNVSVLDNTLGGLHFWGSRGVSGTGTRAYIDGALISTSGIPATTPSPLSLTTGLLIGRGVGLFSGSLSFAIVATADVSSPSSLYNIYKTTLGVGLGLA